MVHIIYKNQDINHHLFYLDFSIYYLYIYFNLLIISSFLIFFFSLSDSLKKYLYLPIDYDFESIYIIQNFFFL